MRFSVCIPVYNSEKFIKKCLDSVLSQTFEDYEIILVDDGSEDASGIICDQYAKKHSNIYVTHQSNQGVIAARAVAVSKSKGEYCLYIDSDDFIFEDALEVLNKYIDEYSAPDCIIFGLERNLNGKPVVSTVKENLLIDNSLELYDLVLSNESFNSVCRKCTKTDILRKFDYKPHSKIHMGEDLVLSLSIYKYSGKVSIVKDVLYHYTMNDTSVTHTVSYDNFQPSYLLYNLVKQFLSENCVTDEKCITDVMTLYADKLIRDVLQIARFEIGRKEKLNKIKELVDNSEDILCNFVHREKFGKRAIVLNALKKYRLRKALFYSQFINKWTYLRQSKK